MLAADLQGRAVHTHLLQTGTPERPIGRILIKTARGWGARESVGTVREVSLHQWVSTADLHNPAVFRTTTTSVVIIRRLRSVPVASA